MLSNEEIARYSRHVIIPEVGMTGQRKLKAAGVLMIGTGGLGAPLGLYLAAAGVGRLGLVYFDVVYVWNLHRRMIHGTRRRPSASARDRGRYQSARRDKLRKTADQRERAAAFRNYDVIVDGTDNFPRAIWSTTPGAHTNPTSGSIFRFEGQATCFGRARRVLPLPVFRTPPPGLVSS
jgi:adenylyltransferase/sulfurtransferase